MNIEIAQRLYEYRKKNNLSQEQLAEKIGVSRQAISKWERAEASPDTDNLLMLSKIYGVSLDELLNNKEADNSTQTPEEKAESNGEPTEDANLHKDHISFRNGIHVHTKSGEKVDIDFSGVHVDCPKDDTHVHIDSNGIFVHERHDKHFNDAVSVKEKPQSQRLFEKFPYPILTAILYIVFGTMNLCGGWAFGWMVFLTIPLYYSLISAIYAKNPAHFAYPVLVVLVYLYVGFFYTAWHPMWLLFLTIPVYYFLCEFFKKISEYERHN